MKSIKKIEIYLIVLVLLLYMLTSLLDISDVFYLYFSLLLAFYFFPIRMFTKDKNQNSLIYFLSSFTISWIIGLSSISFYIQIQGMFRIALLIVSILNLSLAFVLNDKKEEDFLLHILLLFLVPMVLY
jgi:hypothetical protein